LRRAIGGGKLALSMRRRWPTSDRDEALRAIGRATAIGAVLCAAGFGAGCLTVLPTDLPSTPPEPPTIVHDAVQPPADQLLVEWPSELIVPVQVNDSNGSFTYDVFVDYDGNSDDTPYSVAPPGQLGTDGGIATVTIPLQPPAVLTTCHTIQVLVVRGFAVTASGTTLWHTPNELGGDSITWFYTPADGIDGCAIYDAGIYQDGATPSADDGG
jgi:hypothetical protein